MPKKNTPSPAAVALRHAAAELERQAASLREKADRLDGAGKPARAVAKAKPKPKKTAAPKRGKAKGRKSVKVRRKRAKAGGKAPAR